MAGRSGAVYHEGWMQDFILLYERYGGIASMSRTALYRLIAQDMDRHPRTVQRYGSVATARGLIPATGWVNQHGGIRDTTSPTQEAP